MSRELVTRSLMTAHECFAVGSPARSNCLLALSQLDSLMVGEEFVDRGSRRRILDVVEEAVEATSDAGHLFLHEVVRGLWEAVGDVELVEVAS